ncbi:MAG: type II secretion system F family protein [Acidobacteriota bacterium]
MKRHRLDRHEARCLLRLLLLAELDELGGATLTTAADAWSGRLAAAARAAFVALQEGCLLADALTPHLSANVIAVLRAGERSGDRRRGLEAAVELLDESTRSRELLLAPSLRPLLTTGLACVSAGILMVTAVPIFAELQVEMARLGGRIEVDTWLARLAAHPQLAMTAVIVAALPSLLPLLASLSSSTRWGSRFLLRLPLVGDLLRARAAAASGASLSNLLRAGVPLPDSCDLSAEAVDCPSLRASWRRVASDVAAGEPLGPSLQAIGLPGWLFADHRVADDDGVGAAEEMTQLGRERATELSRKLGRFLAVASWTHASVLVFGLTQLVLVSLLQSWSLS